MDEHEWLTSTDPEAMLAFCATPQSAAGRPWSAWKPSDRKLRLVAQNCLAASGLLPWAGVTGDGYPQIPGAFLAGFLSEDDGSAQAALLREIVGNPFRPVTLLTRTVRCDRCKGKGQRVPGVTCGTCDGTGHIAGNADWLTPAVVAIAQAAYDERRRKCSCRGVGTDGQPRPAFACPVCHGTGTIDDGTLDPHRLLVLSDALEEAGCTDESLLQHLRGRERVPSGSELTSGGRTSAMYHWQDLRGPHVRGCWVVDLLLGKE